MWHLLLGTLVLSMLAPAPDFAYDSAAPLHVRSAAPQRNGTVESLELTFASGVQRISATLVRPTDHKRHAGILFVHWLGDPKTTNRTEFLPDALEAATHGATSLLVDAMWSQRDWFETRTPDGDYAASIAQVVALRRAIDVLIGQPDVDATRVAYVGHDFGAMYGALVAGVDRRPSVYVFMTPTTTLWEWYLLGNRPADKYSYIEQMRLLDPTNYLAQATMRATLLQFARGDSYVPATAAREFSAAIPDRDRTEKQYTADHDLATDAAREDRRTWLYTHLASR